MPADVAGAQPAEAGPLSEPRASGGARASWRSSVYGAALALVATGVWLVLSPVPFSYEEQLNPVICGILAIAIGALLLGSGGARPLPFVGAALGIWLIASPFLLDEPRPEKTNLVVLGGIVIVLSLITLAMREEGSRTSRA